MISISNKVIIFCLLGVVYALLSAAKEPSPIATPTKAQPIPETNRGHKGQGRGHGRRGHHGHRGHSHGTLPISKVAEMPPPQYICPPGYHLQDNNTCYRELITPPKEICEFGTLMSPGECILIAPASYECPPGYDYSGHGCTLIETETFLEECPSGSTPCTEGCCMTKVSAVEMVCPLPQLSKKNKKSAGGSCVRFEEVQPELYCENNFQLNGEFCTGLQMAPCPSKPQVVPIIKKSTPPRKLGKNRQKETFSQTFCPTEARVPASFRCPPGSITNEEKKHHHKNDLTCLLPNPVPLQPVCHLPGGIVSPDGSTCEATIVVPPVKSCPQDFNNCAQLLSVADLNGDQCCKLVRTAPTPFCNNGEFVEGKCKSFSPSDLVCYGSSTLIEGMCHEPDTRPALIQSPNQAHKKH